MSAKEAILELVRGMPDDATYPEITDAINGRFGSLDEDGRDLSDEEWQAAWAEEVNRRLADLDAGRTRLIPGEEVMARLRERFG